MSIELIKAETNHKSPAPPPEALKGAANSRGFYEALFFRALAHNDQGLLRIVYSDGRVNFLGKENPDYPVAELIVRDPAMFSQTALFGEIGFGEAYVAGWWDSPAPMAVLAWFMRHADQTPDFAGSVARSVIVGGLRVWNRLHYALRPNTRKTSLRNISEHYDLSNEFFSLWLGQSMAYSAAIYAEEDEDLDSAQLRKFKTIADKLQLSEDVHLLEIGAGWGGFACYAARHYGCRVTSVTISAEQLAMARERARREGVEDRVEFRFQDYRAIEGQYDRIVSIEMVEALGYEYFDVFFRQCARLLKREGIMVVQAITFPDPYFRRYLHSTDFTKKHIFPGSLLLSMREILNSLDRTGDLVLYHVESIGLHYARTLRDWRQRFEASLDRIRELGFNEGFVRKWRYYLMFCETGFAHRYINDVQLVFSRPLNQDLGNYTASGLMS